MAREYSLLERIAGRSGRNRARYEPTTGENLEALMESVRNHLAKLLNSRHGMSAALPDYGLPSLVDVVVDSGNYVQLVQDAIRTTVEKYEPRLKRVRVTRKEEEGNKQTLVFRVDAIMISKSGEHRVWYETSIRGTGKFDVAG
jgi:type VI secretion system protein